MIIVIDHQPGHSAVNANVFPCDEAGLIRAQKHHHVSNVHRIPDAAGRLLQGVRTFIDPVFRVDPPGGNGIHPDSSGKAGCQCMRQCGNASLGRRIALCLRLAHPVPG